MSSNPKRGRTIADETAQLQIGRILKKHGAALAEKALARALTGDSTAMLAAAQLLRLAMQPTPNRPAKTEEKQNA